MTGPLSRVCEFDAGTLIIASVKTSQARAGKVRGGPWPRNAVSAPSNPDPIQGREGKAMNRTLR